MERAHGHTNTHRRARTIKRGEKCVVEETRCAHTSSTSSFRRSATKREKCGPKVQAHSFQLRQKKKTKFTHRDKQTITAFNKHNNNDDDVRSTGRSLRFLRPSSKATRRGRLEATPEASEAIATAEGKEDSGGTRYLQPASGSHVREVTTTSSSAEPKREVFHPRSQTQRSGVSGTASPPVAPGRLSRAKRQQNTPLAFFVLQNQHRCNQLRAAKRASGRAAHTISLS